MWTDPSDDAMSALSVLARAYVDTRNSSYFSRKSFSDQQRHRPVSIKAKEDWRKRKTLEGNLESDRKTANARASSSSANANERPLTRERRRSKGYNKSPSHEENERANWFPIAFSSSLKRGKEKKMIAFDLFNVPWVLFRNDLDEIGCVKDECAHRACPLSLGVQVNGNVQCAYHGWEFTKDGECVNMPSCKTLLRGVFVDAMDVYEHDGMIFVWAGDYEACGVDDQRHPVNAYSGERSLKAPEGVSVNGTPFLTCAEIELEFENDCDILTERLFTLTQRAINKTKLVEKKTGSLEKIFDLVDVNAQIAKALRWGWRPVPNEIKFVPSSALVSTIDIQRMYGDSIPRRVHQVHVCLPSRPGKTRVLFRMALDFLPESALVAAPKVWANLARQILKEELNDVEDCTILSQDEEEAMSNYLSFKRSFARITEEDERDDDANNTSAVVSGENRKPLKLL